VSAYYENAQVETCPVLKANFNDKLYSPQMVVTANTTKYTIENDLTKKKKRKTNKQTHRQNGMYLSKKDQLVIKQDL